MKEYKIIKQKTKVFGDNDATFEKELNDYARLGWQVTSAVMPSHSTAMKVILERTKN
ncbi:DUF4177 domain-containing protein [Flavobacteriaceae bacterium TP-CH-4]|uniref:DUF4177 domain-containing protein n=1 Tax=Pelagihabitans pacificus TaxID=2696054 RepID=A0A967AXY6_9FLAO|nr:DUF4177 domain-containing protein [Pelagihabitans pacificus]NHF61355.1 DUF4177 domain-containing protein [Pelagihabitans pacificus]